MSMFSQMKKARKPDKINVFGLAGDSETRTHDPLNALGISGFLQVYRTFDRFKKWLIYQQNWYLQILLLRVSSAPFCEWCDLFVTTILKKYYVNIASTPSVDLLSNSLFYSLFSRDFPTKSSRGTDQYQLFLNLGSYPSSPPSPSQDKNSNPFCSLHCFTSYSRLSSKSSTTG